MGFRSFGKFLLVLLAFCLRVVVGSIKENETDKMSLLAFKKSINLDPHNVFMSWNDSNHFCSWQGVDCNMKNPRRVTSLDLANMGLAGQIHSSLGNLTFLKHIFLQSNRITNEIPSSLGRLHHLRTLRLSENMLIGAIPSFRNCSVLEVLWLDRNFLVGQFPVVLPHHLEQLQISYNNITGFIPPSLANITTLNMLSCVTNIIKGNVPREFAKLPNLKLLYVGGNKFTGGFPQVICNISTLVQLNIALNHLKGKIPSSIGNALPNLTVLQLAGNMFHGNIPCSIINASKLYRLEISDNYFTGTVPRSIGKIAQLSILNLDSNKLEATSNQDWEFMNSLANCSRLQILSIAGNLLEGNVPNSLGNVSIQLSGLYLGGNQLSGGFPSRIDNLKNLIVLELGSNLFTGTIPEWLGTLNKLQGIYLNNNLFTGFVPPALSNLSQLGYIFLDSNQLDGYLSPSLGSLQMLGILSISNNNIHGRVPKEIFSIPTLMQIELSFNNLEGHLPTEVGNAKQLIYLQLSSNNLSGHIPNTLDNCQSLERVKLDRNFFTGSIPTSLGNISSLVFLNLSHNNLTGSIPMSLVNLQLLEQLDLSFNHLNGEVPMKGIFSNVSAVRIDENSGLCGGPRELHLLACSFMPLHSSGHKRSTIKKLVIPFGSMVSLAIIISVILIWRQKQTTKSATLPSFCKNLPQVSYIDLVRATDGFSAMNLIGSGRYSSVYQGKLFQERTKVAIKVFSLETKGAQNSFIAECNILKNVRHRNLVPILTACSSIDSNGNDFKALVYKLMPQGDLHKLLYSTRGDNNTSIRRHISMAQRLSIEVDIADALEYLHHSNQGTIVHCDLKPSNILLDENMTAHVGDFGLTRFIVDSESSFSDSTSTSSVVVKGTIGYAAPECASGGVSSAGDVYSFGIVLLEIFLRRRPTDDIFHDGLNIAKYVEMHFPGTIAQIIDPELLEENQDFLHESSMDMKEKSLECLLSVLRIGLCCTKPSPSERMCMQEVAARLHKTKEAYLS